VPLMLLKFRKIVGKGSRAIRFEVDKDHSPVVPADVVELKGEEIYAIYRVSDGVYVVYRTTDLDGFAYYLAGGVPEGTELLSRVTYTYQVCPICGGYVRDNYDAHQCIRCGTIIDEDYLGKVKEVEAVVYEPKPFDCAKVLRGWPPETREDLEALKRAGAAETAAEETRDRAKRTREELARLRPPDWADGLYFEPSVFSTHLSHTM